MAVLTASNAYHIGTKIGLQDSPIIIIIIIIIIIPLKNSIQTGKYSSWHCENLQKNATRQLYSAVRQLLQSDTVTDNSQVLILAHKWQSLPPSLSKPFLSDNTHCSASLPYLTFNFIQNVHCHRAQMDMCAFVASWMWLTETYSWRQLRRNIDQTRRMWIIRQKGDKIQLFDFIKRLQGQFETDTYQRGIGTHLCWAEVLCWSTM